MKKKDPLIQIENKFATEALYKMTLIEQKIFYILLYKQNLHTENEFGEIGLKLAELKIILEEEEEKYKSLYSKLDVLSKKMSEQTFRFVTKVKVKDKCLHGFVPLFQSVTPQSNEHGEVTIYFRFNDLLKPFLMQFNEYVTMNQLCITELKSLYTIRLYTILKEMQTKNQESGDTIRATWEREKFRELIGVNRQYPRFYDLKKRVIEPASKEINTKTDIIIIDIQQIETDRNIKKIRFIFTNQVEPTTIEESSTGDIPF